MPKVIAIKATHETLGGSIDWDIAVEPEELKAFLNSACIARDPRYPLRQSYRGDFDASTIEGYWWEPNFPFSNNVMCMGISEEALYRSNYRVVVEDIRNVSPDVIVDHNSIYFDVADTVGLARACMWERDMDGYPVADDDDHSYMEQDLIEEAYNDYGKDDFVRFLSDLDALSELFNEDGEPLEEYWPYLEPYVYRCAADAVYYSGEMYPDEHTVENGLSDELYQTGDLDLKLSHYGEERLNMYLQRLVQAVKLDKATEDRRIEETVQTTMFPEHEAQ